MRRELRVARWVLTRLDALSPEELLRENDTGDGSQDPGTQPHREVTWILFQSNEDGGDRQARSAFQRAASSMANRYLRQMPTFHGRGIEDVAKLLETQPDVLPRRHADDLERRVWAARGRVGLAVGADLESQVERYTASTKDRDNGEDVRRAMLIILIERYARRNPQRGLFESESEEATGAMPKADANVAHAARLQLMHEYGRAFYYGMDDVIAASSGNTEHFLHLIGDLVAKSETQLVRGRPAGLRSRFQHDQLRKKASDVIAEWNFPYSREVRSLVKQLAEECRVASVAPNARLGPGAGAIGVPQREFDRLLDSRVDSGMTVLANVLKFGVAYNAFQLRRNYRQGTQGSDPWCLIELDGLVRLATGLTFQRGGFIEKRVSDLVVMVDSPGDDL